MATLQSGNDQFSDAETVRRRDEVVRRMANTPPQPKVNPRPKKKTKAASDRAADKRRARRED